MDIIGRIMNVDILLNSLNAGIGDTLYALVDGAQFAEFSNKFAQNGSVVWTSLLPDGTPSDAVAVGPILMQLSDTSRTVIEALLAQSTDRNFVSFISTGADDIALHLRLLTDVTHDDGTEWVMRYYDPRVISTWIQALNDEQRAHVCAPINSWVYRDIHGDYVAIRGRNSQNSADGFQFVLSQSQQDAMMRGSMPYLIRNMILEDDADAFSNDSELEQCAYMSAQISRASRYGLTEIVDCKLYCLLALKLPSNFYSHPLMTEILREPSAFASRIQALTANEWRLLLQTRADA